MDVTGANQGFLATLISGPRLPVERMFFVKPPQADGNTEGADPFKGFGFEIGIRTMKETDI
jgi:hypothetical protein